MYLPLRVIPRVDLATGAFLISKAALSGSSSIQASISAARFTVFIEDNIQHTILYIKLISATRGSD